MRSRFIHKLLLIIRSLQHLKVEVLLSQLFSMCQLQMKVAVLIPSHIYYPDQITRLDACLESLCSQTIVPDIFASISFADYTYKLAFAPILRKFATVKFKFSPGQTFQMEHLLALSALISDYDMVMFCDDDDKYLPIRVEAFVNAFKGTKEHCDKTGKRFGGVREVLDARDENEIPEYWAYGIQPVLFTEFFNRIKGYEDLMRHKFADIYLCNFLKRTGGSSTIFGSLQPNMSGVTLYQYTTDNPNSICSRLQRGASKRTSIDVQNNLTLCLIYNWEDELREQMRAIHMPLSKLCDIVPDTVKIKTFTKHLYK